MDTTEMDTNETSEARALVRMTETKKPPPPYWDSGNQEHQPGPSRTGIYPEAAQTPQQYPSPHQHFPQTAQYPQHGQQQQTVVLMQPTEQTLQPAVIRAPPSNYMWLAIITCLCCCGPLGCIAICCAYMSSQAAARNDMVEAGSRAGVSKTLSIIGIVIGAMTWIIIIVLIANLYFLSTPENRKRPTKL